MISRIALNKCAHLPNHCNEARASLVDALTRTYARKYERKKLGQNLLFWGHVPGAGGSARNRSMALQLTRSWPN